MTELQGDSDLEAVGWIDKQTGQVRSAPVRSSFCNDWRVPQHRLAASAVFFDENGFILTGRELPQTVQSDRNPLWSLSRSRELLETSLPGVFAIGDVRAGASSEWLQPWGRELLP